MFLLLSLSVIDRFGLFPEIRAVNAESVVDLLRFMATGMLTIITVMLSVLVVVLSLAAGQASPRSVPELMADPVTQNALSTFIATLVFALTAQGLIEFGAIDATGITAVLALALLIVAWAFKYLIQWIHHVVDTLKLNKIIARVHDQAHCALEDFFADETRPGGPEPEVAQSTDTMAVVHAARVGYVQVIDRRDIGVIADKENLHLNVTVREGDFVHPATAIMEVYSESELVGDTREHLQNAVVIASERSLEKDPLLGFELLTEIAGRALSPSLNDPQTAIICVNYLKALLVHAGGISAKDYPQGRSKSGRVLYRSVTFHDMLKRSVRPIVREGAGSAEVIFAIADAMWEIATQATVDNLDSLPDELTQIEAFGEKQLLLDRDKKQLRSMISRVRTTLQNRHGN